MNSKTKPTLTSAWQLLSVVAVVSLLCAASGCGDGLAQVSGVVTLDGQPLHGGSGDTRITVQFQPAGGLGSTAIGLADESGRYTLATGSKTGIPPGEYLVSCSASQLTPGNGQTAGGVRAIVDRKYANAKTSWLSFTVVPGQNECNIALASSDGSK
jgi:hypothetical protein